MNVLDNDYFLIFCSLALQLHRNSKQHGRHESELFNYHVTSFFMDLCQYEMTIQYPVRKVYTVFKKSPVIGLSKVCFCCSDWKVDWTGVRLIDVNTTGLL